MHSSIQTLVPRLVKIVKGKMTKMVCGLLDTNKIKKVCISDYLRFRYVDPLERYLQLYWIGQNAIFSLQ